MTSPAFLALGDLHLDTLIWRAYRQVTGDAVQAFKAVTQIAVDRHLPLVLVGDVFDVVDPDPWLVREFRLEMDRLAAECVPVDVLQGNHDRRRTPWTTAVHDHPRYIGDGKTRMIGGLRCVAYDYDTRDNIQRKLSELQAKLVDQQNGPQVLFLHQAVKQALRFEGQWNCDLEWVPEQIPLVVMGDIHTEWSARVRPGQMAYYTGASHPRDLSQLGQKTCMLINDDLTVERIPFPGRPIHALQIVDEAGVREARAWIDEALAASPVLPPALFLKFGPDVGRQVTDMEAEFTPRVLIMSKPLTEVNLDMTVEQVTRDTTLDADQLLRQLIDPEKEPSAYQLITELLNSQDPVVDVIHNRREHFTV